MKTPLFDKVENTVGKGENPGNLLLFYSVFQSLLLWGGLKSGLCCKELTLSQKSPCFYVCLFVFGFNATLTAKVISWRLVMHMCFLAFSHQY